MFKHFFSLRAIRQTLFIATEGLLNAVANDKCSNISTFQCNFLRVTSILTRLRARLGAHQLAQHSSKKLPLGVLL